MPRARTRAYHVDAECRRLAVREEVWQNLTACIEESRLSTGRTRARLIEHHKKFIHKSNLQGKGKYTTLNVLTQFLNTCAHGGIRLALHTADRTLVRHKMAGLIESSS